MSAMDVLIVEDDRLARMGLIRIMPWKEQGMRIVGEASNGLEALQFMKTSHVDLVLSDIEMPGMQGLDFIEQASALYPNVYFVVLTIYTDFSHIQQALRLGAIDYIAKTDFDRENYSMILKRIVDRIHKEEIRKRNLRITKKTPDMGQLLTEWADLSWLWQKNKQAVLLDELNNYELSQTQLKRLVERILAEWNNQYSLIANDRLEEPQVMTGTEFSFAEWINLLSEKTRKLLTSFSYSEDIFISVTGVCAEIRNELDCPIRISDIAQRTHLSRSYFCQCFRDLYRMSFIDYLRRLRMEKAVELLLSTNASIQMIAKITGYDDEKYFSRIFKSVYSVSPFEYRKVHRKREE